MVTTNLCLVRVTIKYIWKLCNFSHKSRVTEVYWFWNTCVFSLNSAFRAFFSSASCFFSWYSARSSSSYVLLRPRVCSSIWSKGPQKGLTAVCSAPSAMVLVNLHHSSCLKRFTLTRLLVLIVVCFVLFVLFVCFFFFSFWFLFYDCTLLNMNTDWNDLGQIMLLKILLLHN